MKRTKRETVDEMLFGDWKRARLELRASVHHGKVPADFDYSIEEKVEDEDEDDVDGMDSTE